jgi:hypothetical protein
MGATESWEKYKANKLNEKQSQTKDFIDEMMTDMFEILEDVYKVGYNNGYSDCEAQNGLDGP